jgi:hypothetical protein
MVEMRYVGRPDTMTSFSITRMMAVEDLIKTFAAKTFFCQARAHHVATPPNPMAQSNC